MAVTAGSAGCMSGGPTLLLAYSLEGEVAAVWHSDLDAATTYSGWAIHFCEIDWAIRLKETGMLF